MVSAGVNTTISKLADVFPVKVDTITKASEQLNTLPNELVSLVGPKSVLKV